MEAAQLGVNPPTALRMLDDFVQLLPPPLPTPPMTPTRGGGKGECATSAAAAVVLNAPTSAVGRDTFVHFPHT